MGLSRRGARAAQQRALRRAAAGTVVGAATAGDTRDEPAFYDRGDEYGGGGKYQPPGIAAYGASRYDTGATYGEAESAATVARYDDGFWYGRNGTYGE